MKFKFQIRSEENKKMILVLKKDRTEKKKDTVENQVLKEKDLEDQIQEKENLRLTENLQATEANEKEEENKKRAPPGWLSSFY